MLVRVQKFEHYLTRGLGYSEVRGLKRDPVDRTVFRDVGSSGHRPEFERTTVNVFPDLFADDRITFLHVATIGIKHGGIVDHKTVIRVGVKEVLQNVRAFPFDCSCEGLFPRSSEAVEVGLKLAIRELPQGFLPDQRLLLHGRNVFIRSKSSINLVIDLR